MLLYINWTQKLGGVLESMDVAIAYQEIAMAVLSGLPPVYQNVITAWNALSTDGMIFNLDLVPS